MTFSEAISGMKLKSCSNIDTISLYKNYVFIAVAYVLWLLSPLQVSIDL